MLVFKLGFGFGGADSNVICIPCIFLWKGDFCFILKSTANPFGWCMVYISIFFS